MAAGCAIEEVMCIYSVYIYIYTCIRVYTHLLTLHTPIDTYVAIIIVKIIYQKGISMTMALMAMSYKYLDSRLAA